MKRNLITVLAVEERQWEWAVYQAAGREAKSLAKGRVPVPEDASADLATVIPKIRDELQEHWDAHNIPYRGCRLVLGMPLQEVMLRVLDLPGTDPDELREMSALQIEKLSPFAADKNSIACETLATQEGRSRVLAAGINLDPLEQIAAVFRATGLSAKRVDLNICAHWENITRTTKDSGNVAERVVHLVLSSDACDAVIADAGVPILFRELARRDKMTDSEYAAEIASQTAYSLATCDLEHGSSSSTAVLIRYSGKETLPDLSVALQDIGVNEVTALPLDGMPDTCDGLVRRAVMHGSAHRFLDLAPPAWQMAEIDRSRRQRLLLVASAAAAVWLAAVGGIYASLLLEQRRLNAVGRRHADMEYYYNQVTNTRQRVHNLANYTDQSRSVLETLREISARQPRGIDLTSFDYRKGLLIRVAGEAENAALIYNFKNELDASSLFGGTDPPSIARTARGGRETFRLNIHLPDDAGRTGQP